MLSLEVVDYDPAWPAYFAEIAERVSMAFANGPRIAVQHIGSTSVAGLAAKPVIDLDVIVPLASDIPDAIGRLATLGYIHQGDRGIAGREAFLSPPETRQHHLYLCLCDGVEYQRHIAFRDYLRANRDEAQRYERLKRDLAIRFPDNREAYTIGKTEYISGIMQNLSCHETQTYTKF